MLFCGVFLSWAEVVLTCLWEMRRQAAMGDAPACLGMHLSYHPCAARLSLPISRPWHPKPTHLECPGVAPPSAQHVGRRCGTTSQRRPCILHMCCGDSFSETGDIPHHLGLKPATCIGTKHPLEQMTHPGEPGWCGICLAIVFKEPL